MFDRSRHDRSRSVAVDQYFRICRAEKRGRKSWKRRFRNFCIKALQLFVNLLQELLRHFLPSKARVVTQDPLYTAIYNRERVLDREWEPVPVVERHKLRLKSVKGEQPSLVFALVHPGKTVASVNQFSGPSLLSLTKLC